MTREEAEAYAAWKGWRPASLGTGTPARFWILAENTGPWPASLPRAVFAALPGHAGDDTTHGWFHYHNYPTKQAAYEALYGALETLDPVLLALAGE